MMKVAVTGANGHLGANVVRALIEAGHGVIAMVRRGTDTNSLDGLDIEIRHGDVLDPDSLVRAFKDASHVINLAAVISISGDKDGLVSRTNVGGPTNVAEACKTLGVKRMVHVSSIHAFVSNPEMPVVDENATRPGAKAFAYDRSKYQGEQAALKAAADELDIIILNPTGIIGPHDHGTSFTGKMLQQMFEGRLPALVNAGFDWVDVRDVAQACVAALIQGRPNENHILSGRYATIPELAALCEKTSGTKAPKIALPIWVATLGLPFLASWSKLTCSPPLYTWESLMILKDANRNVSSAKAASELGYSARPLEQTIADCYQWYSREL